MNNETYTAFITFGVGFIILAAVSGFLVRLLRNALEKPFKITRKHSQQTTNQYETIKTVKGQYEAVHILTNRELTAFQTILAYCTKHNLLVFTKVRLIDLVQPKNGIADYVVCRNKVIQKHVDFVICDPEVNVKLIIELDDWTHERPDRQARDSFVDAVLEEVGYKIIHSYTITSELLESSLPLATKPSEA